ncbi:MAG: nuclear transport factor 2 family protein [Flavobacteriales bacterium]
MRVLSSLFLLLLAFSCSGPSPSFDKEKARKRIQQLLDDWHRAAARADKKGYFGAMDSNAVFIGTDPSERWKKSAFEEWASPHFKGDQAWKFHPSDRHLRFGPQGKTAWFDEKLDTWMGTCRGSGVLLRRSKGWRLAHYHLSKTIPNGRMDTVLKVLEVSPAR